MTPSLRPANPADLDAIAHIHRTARAAAMPWLPVVHSAAEDRRFFKTRVLPEQSVHVAVIDGQIAGFAAWAEGWLNHLYVAPPYWRQGAGVALLRAAQTAQGRLSLWAFQDNHAARAFYAAHGFAEVAFTDGSGNEERTPDVRLSWGAETAE